MTIINAISKTQEGEPVSVQLNSGILVSGIFKGIEDKLLKMIDVYVICQGYQYSSPRALVEINTVEMCLPGEEELSFRQS
jgi:hypothetical protein